MGQNREAKKTNRMLDQEYARQGQQYGDYDQSRNQYANEARGRSDRAFESAFGGYQDIFNGAGGGRGGGSYNPRSINRGRSDPRYFQEFADTGGLTSENIARMRGNGVFDEFSKTGGLSEDDIANMRLHGSRTIPGFFDALRTNLQRSTNVSGYNPGYGAQFRSLARDQAREAQNAALETELGITNQRNQGRMWGTEGVSNAERGVVDANFRGRSFGIEGLDSQNKFDRQMDFDIDRFEDDQQRYRSESGREDSRYRDANRLAALEGIGNLRGQAPGEVGMYEDLISGNMGQNASNRRGLIQDRMQYNPNQNWFDKYGMPLINAGAGVASGFGTRAPSGGGGSFSDFFNRRRNRNTGFNPGGSVPNAGMGFGGVPYLG